MKRGYFLFFLLIISFLFLYSPYYVKGQGNQEQCFSESNSGFLSVNEESKDMNVVYIYEELETKDWKIRSNGEIYQLIINDLNSDKVQIELPISTTRSGKSEGNCEYYSFSYVREAKNLVYELPRESPEPLEVGDKLYCKYSVAEIEEDVHKILNLGGRALEVGNICPESREKELETGTLECPQTQTCEVVINSGEREFYGFSVSKDSCGNKIIERDNNGNSFSESEIETRAEESLNACRIQVKAIVREQVKKEAETGSDDENNQQQTQTQPSGKKSSSLFSCTGGVDKNIPECNDDKDNDGDSLIDCKTKNGGEVNLDESDPGCFSCSTGKLKCNPSDDDERDGDITYLNCPEGQIQCGPYCYDPAKYQCGGVKKGVSNICDEGFNQLKQLAQCENEFDDDEDGLIDEVDPDCFKCDSSNGIFGYDSKKSEGNMCPPVNYPEKTLQCGEQCYNPKTHVCFGQFIEQDNKCAVEGVEKNCNLEFERKCGGVEQGGIWCCNKELNKCGTEYEACDYCEEGLCGDVWIESAKKCTSGLDGECFDSTKSCSEFKCYNGECRYKPLERGTLCRTFSNKEGYCDGRGKCFLDTPCTKNSDCGGKPPGGSDECAEVCIAGNCAFNVSVGGCRTFLSGQKGGHCNNGYCIHEGVGIFDGVGATKKCKGDNECDKTWNGDGCWSEKCINYEYIDGERIGQCIKIPNSIGKCIINGDEGMCFNGLCYAK